MARPPEQLMKKRSTDKRVIDKLLTNHKNTTQHSEYKLFSKSESIRTFCHFFILNCQLTEELNFPHQIQDVVNIYFSRYV